MRTVEINRVKSNFNGTFGILRTDGFSCYTLELPWRNNSKNISCIPMGTYECKIRFSPKFGKVYWVTNVPNRSYILIHSGNLAGDREKGLITHTYGCILLGKYFGVLGNQEAVLVSKTTLRRFIENMKGEPFLLKINERGEE